MRLSEILNKIENLAPQWFLAIAVIFVSIALIIYNKPPHQFCDTQKKAFINQQKKFLASKSYDSFFQRCLSSNNRGACEPYFVGFKKMLDDFKVIDEKCLQTVVESPRVRSALTSFLVQVARLVWGSNGPSTIYGLGGWFGPSHFRTFCRVKSRYSQSYGEKAYEALVDKILNILPNKKKFTKIQKRDRSLFATPCSQYF